MANPYYLCAYAHVVRVSGRHPNTQEGKNAAAIEMFGVSGNVTVLAINGKMWKYLSQKEQRGHMLYLARMHFKRTGSVCGGFKQEELQPTVENKKKPKI